MASRLTLKLREELEYLCFPTHFDVGVKIKQTVENHDVQIEYVAELIKRDPMITAKVLQEAGRISKNPGGILTIPKAVVCLGSKHATRIAILTANKQIELSRCIIQYASLSRLIWLNTMYAASAAFVLADNRSSFDPEEAFTLGSFINIGAFQMLYQVASLDERDQYDQIVDNVKEYYARRTFDVLTMLNFKPETVGSVLIEDNASRSFNAEDFKNMSDLLYAANGLARMTYPWISDDYVLKEHRSFDPLMPEIEAMFKQLRTFDIPRRQT